MSRETTPISLRRRLSDAALEGMGAVEGCLGRAGGPLGVEIGITEHKMVSTATPNGEV